MKKVMTFGTFDILHPGHINYLQQAKALGDYLVVVIARDKTIKKTKKIDPDNYEEKRLEKIQNLDFVNLTVLGHLDDPYKIINEIKPDIIALGYDQKNFTKNLKSELKKRNLDCKIIRLKPYYPKKYKSSLLRKIKNR